MASIQGPIASPFLKAMEDTLATQMRAYLKAPLLKDAEAKIDEAVEAAVKDMRPRIEAHLRTYDMSAVINIIQERKP